MPSQTSGGLQGRGGLPRHSRPDTGRGAASFACPWELALGDFAGIFEDLRGEARAILADQVAFTFRGCLSFWIAGEIAEEGLSSAVETATATALLGFAASRHRERVLAAMTLDTTPGDPADSPE